MNKSAIFKQAHVFAKRTTKKFGGDYSANLKGSLLFIYSLIKASKGDIIKDGSTNYIFSKTGTNKTGDYLEVKVGSDAFNHYAKKGAEFKRESLRGDIYATMTISKIGKKFNKEDGEYVYVYYTTRKLNKAA